MRVKKIAARKKFAGGKVFNRPTSSHNFRQLSHQPFWVSSDFSQKVQNARVYAIKYLEESPMYPVVFDFENNQTSVPRTKFPIQFWHRPITQSEMNSFR
jgi:hypothetical protein